MPLVSALLQGAPDFLFAIFQPEDFQPHPLHTEVHEVLRLGTLISFGRESGKGQQELLGKALFC